MSASRFFLLPTVDQENLGTYDRIRALNPTFTGIVFGMPSALVSWDTVLDESQAYDPGRDTPSFLTTNAPLDRWAMALNNDFGRTVPNGSRPVDYLPYFAFIASKQYNKLTDGASLGYAPSAEPKVRCRPLPFAIDPSLPLAASVFAESVIATCTPYGASAVMTDDHTCEYGPGATNVVVKLNVPVPVSGRGETCSSDLSGVRFAMVRNGNVNMYTTAPYTRFRPDVCRGGRVLHSKFLADERDKCASAITVERNRMLGDVSRLLRADEPTAGRVRVWANLYSLSRWSQDGRKIPIRPDYQTRDFDQLLASRLGGPTEVLEAGGWWEKFCLDWNASVDSDSKTKNYFFPLAKNVPTSPVERFHWVQNGKQRITISTRVEDEPREELAIYRQRPVDATLWHLAMRIISAAVEVEGKIRVETGFTSIDELHYALSSYLICRTSAPGELGRWGSVAADRPIPEVSGFYLRKPVMSLFPRFIHPDFQRGLKLLCSQDFRSAERCDFDCIGSGFIGPQAPVSTHPVIVRDTLAGPFSSHDGSRRDTYLRLLLDVELGRPLGYCQQDGMFLVRFEYGEVVAYPIPDGLDVGPKEGDPYPLKMYRPVPPKGQSALFLAVDAAAVDTLVTGGSQAIHVLEDRLPTWALARQTATRSANSETPIPANRLVLQRALESGLQDAGDPSVGRKGVPGICLRRVDREWPKIPLLPGTGKVIVYSDSPSARLWREYFSLPVSGTPRLVAQNAAEFVSNRLGGPPVVLRGDVSVRGHR